MRYRHHEVVLTLRIPDGPMMPLDQEWFGLWHLTEASWDQATKDITRTADGVECVATDGWWLTLTFCATNRATLAELEAEIERAFGK